MNRETVAFALGFVVGATTVANVAAKQYRDFAKWDEKKNAFIEDLFDKFQDHAPREVIDEVRVNATFLNMALREGL